MVAKKNTLPTQGSFLCSDGHEEPWTLRISDKARRCSIKMSARRGLELVFPRRSFQTPERLLSENRNAVENMIAKMGAARGKYLRDAAGPLPSSIDFPAAGECWHLTYRQTDAKGITVRVSAGADALLGGELSVSGPVEDRAAVCAGLKRFVLRRAKEVLPLLLAADAEELGVRFADCRVSSARTRWGSCSADGRIMLSSSLMFLPSHLVHHVICHELSHIGHMDHSGAFHTRLEQLDSEAKRCARELRDADGYLPFWIYG